MKLHKITEKQLFTMVEERMSLQSTQRSLESYKLPKYSLNYFKSEEFSKVFTTWDEYKKQQFLKSLAGTYWKTIAPYINK